MRIQSQDSAVQFFGFGERFCFMSQPVEQWHHGFIAIQNETFGMPLYTEYGFSFCTFDCFYDSVFGACGNPEPRSRLADCLMME